MRTPTELLTTESALPHPNIPTTEEIIAGLSRMSQNSTPLPGPLSSNTLDDQNGSPEDTSTETQSESSVYTYEEEDEDEDGDDDDDSLTLEPPLSPRLRAAVRDPSSNGETVVYYGHCQTQKASRPPRPV